MKFRKKPVVIEAVQMIPTSPYVAQPLPDWLRAAFNRATEDKGAVFYEDGTLYVHSLEGVVTCPLGHWIIQGVKGELYPCDPDIFAATYSPELEA